MDSPQVKTPIDLPSIAVNENVKFALEAHGLEFTSNGQLVRWSSSNKKHPRNWPLSRKIYDSSLIIFLDFFTTSISTAGSTAADHAHREFGTDHTLSIFIFVSLYLIGQAVGGIIFPSYSEAFGRKRLYIISTGLYSVFCVIVGVAPSLAGVSIGRLFSGFLSAIPTIVVAGSIEDMFNSKDRIWLIFLWAMVANMGLAVGPIMSSYITAHLGWHWVFHIAAIVTGITTIFLFGIRESRPSLLLVREVAKIRECGIPTLQALNPDHTPDLRAWARLALFRPIKLFFTEPIVFMVATMSAVAFGLIYMFTEALPLVYQSMGFVETSSSLPFLAIIIGLILGLLTRIQDHRTILRHEQKGLPLEPEHKLLGFSIGVPMLAGGLWWFAWTIPPLVTSVHWIVSTASLVLIGYAINEFDCILAGYLADSYLSFAASGFAALSLVRSLMSAAFPLFATQMFNGLGANVASSILAAVATVFCIVPPLFSRYGRTIRARSKFARYSLQVYQENGVDKYGY